jgi:hypothetical protein
VHSADATAHAAGAPLSTPRVGEDRGRRPPISAR